MTKKEQKKVMAKAIERYGVDAQLNTAIEECAELIVAMRHYLRGRESGLSELYGEIADVTIVLAQLRLMLSESTIDNAIDWKLRRLKHRLEGKE